MRVRGSLVRWTVGLPRQICACLLADQSLAGGRAQHRNERRSVESIRLALLRNELQARLALTLFARSTVILG